MALHSARGTMQRGAQATSQPHRVPAPIHGIDSRTILSEGNPYNCIYCYNMVPSEYGMQVRKGYREWCINLDNGNYSTTGTIIPFGGVDDDASDDRLFAVTNEGIWDVTTFDTPVLALDFLDVGNGQDTSPSAGYGVYTHFTTNADEQLVFYADSRNGLFQYSETTGLWVRTPDFTYAGGTPPVVANINFVTTHKERIWFIERNDSKAWFLPAEAILGDVTPFFFGSKFKHGGNLAALYSWTIDGGEGIDDYLVAISRAGDVLPYLGNDPTSANDWAAKGQFFIGAVPEGNRFGSEHGGNLQLLSSYGLVSMDDLVRGVDGKNEGAKTDTLAIASIIRNEMTDYRNEEGWDVRLLPAQGNLLISQPLRNDGTYRQYALNQTTNGWGIWRDLDMNAFDEWGGKVYFGDKSGRVLVMDIPLDNSLITPDPLATVNGLPIDFSLLTTFQNWNAPTLFKRGKYVRADFVSQTVPSQTSKFQYDFNLTEITNLDTAPLFAGARWDIDLWDQSIWSAGAPDGRNELAGGWGMGRYVAIAMRGTSTTDTTLVGWDVLYDIGAPI